MWCYVNGVPADGHARLTAKSEHAIEMPSSVHKREDADDDLPRREAF